MPFAELHILRSCLESPPPLLNKVPMLLHADSQPDTAMYPHSRVNHKAQPQVYTQAGYLLGAIAGCCSKVTAVHITSPRINSSSGTVLNQTTHAACHNYVCQINTLQKPSLVK